VAASKTPPRRIRTSSLDPEIDRFVRSQMRRTGTPGVAVGVLLGSRAQAAGFGITSVEAPSDVDEETMFQIGSTTKTFTATAVMRLVERGNLDLDVPIRRYLRGLRLKDPGVTRRVTLRHLLTHTGGWVGDYFSETGRGDDALAKVVEMLHKVPQITPLGEVWHYNNAGFYLAGRVIEASYGKPYETAITELLLQPLGMTRSFFFADEAVVYRVAAGHLGKGTRHTVTTPWALPRNVHAAGGIISDVIDQLRWAQFHMGDGRAPDGKRLLRASTLRTMQRAHAPAGSIADSIGLSWLLSDVDGARIVEHGGTTNGHLSAFLMVPERRFAIAVLTNSTRGGEVHHAVVDRALAHYLGLRRRPPRPLARGRVDAHAYAGRYIDGLRQSAFDLVALRDGRLKGTLSSLDGEESPVPIAPFHVAFYDADRAVVQDSRIKGSRLEFLRDDRGRLRFVRVGGRLMRRTSAAKR
jgi:CubicO group peptidase (beta-lactamase class C family)